MTLEPGAYTPEEVSQDRYGQPHEGFSRQPLPRTLEDRVAALEELIAHPPMTIEVPDHWTDKQLEEFREKAAEALQLPEPPGRPRAWDFVMATPARTPVPPPETVRDLLSACVTVVKPGETLVIRVRNWTPAQAEQYQEYLDAVWADLPFRVVVAIGDELAVSPAQRKAD